MGFVHFVCAVARGIFTISMAADRTAAAVAAVTAATTTTTERKKLFNRMKSNICTLCVVVVAITFQRNFSGPYVIGKIPFAIVIFHSIPRPQPSGLALPSAIALASPLAVNLTRSGHY